jgi:predicted nucleic acid-binding Zn ribbon protein
MAKTPEHHDGNTQHIGQAIQQLLNSYHIKAKFDEANLIGSWERMVGKPIAKRTKKVFIRNKVMFVELESPSMKSELSFHKKEIIDLFQKEFGPDIIKEMVIM